MAQVQTSISIDSELMMIADAMAKQERRSRSNMIATLVSEAIDIRKSQAACRAQLDKALAESAA